MKLVFFINKLKDTTKVEKLKLNFFLNKPPPPNLLPPNLPLPYLPPPSLPSTTTSHLSGVDIYSGKDARDECSDAKHEDGENGSRSANLYEEVEDTSYQEVEGDHQTPAKVVHQEVVDGNYCVRVMEIRE